MDLYFREASPDDAETIGRMVIQLTREICKLTETQHFNIDSMETIKRCHSLLTEGHYAAILGYQADRPVAVSTLTETYALYAGGKIGTIQECYVIPDVRSAGVGAALIEQVRRYGYIRDWVCIELCTPPLPEFERTVNFYRKNGLEPVGGRKMRGYL